VVGVGVIGQFCWKRGRPIFPRESMTDTMADFTQ
jgi:hypothetical protein